MPDWKTETEVRKDAKVFVNFVHALLGVYLYEWLLSLNFDWDFIIGKKKFRWPMIFYFANRYLLLFAMIGIVIALDATRKIDCQVLYTFNQLAGDAAVGLASINLSIRTIAVWAKNKYIIGFLIFAIFGHWSLILQGAQLRAAWVDGAGCVITKANNKILAAIFIYSMCFDLTVLLLNIYKLLGIKPVPSELKTSRLTRMIFTDGLIFFIIAFLANLLATAFMVLNLNQIMSVIFNVPAAVSSTIVACRAVRRLANFTNHGAETFTPVSLHSAVENVRFNPGGSTTVPIRGIPSMHSIKNTPKTGVRIQMETFTKSEGGNCKGYESGVEHSIDGGSDHAIDLSLEEV